MKSFDLFGSRKLCSCAISCLLLTLSAAPALADVKTRDKGQVKFEGMLGTMMRMFGGKALSEVRKHVDKAEKLADGPANGSAVAAQLDNAAKKSGASPWEWGAWVIGGDWR